jgi:hypothetical protein
MKQIVYLNVEWEAHRLINTRGNNIGQIKAMSS